jgi:TRAP-type C4-dicarboxylate transport system permease small subunit
MARVNRIIDTLLFYLLSVALASVVGICILQVVARYLFSSSFTWAEEVSIVLLLWATWGGACLALKQGVHLKVHVLEDRLPEKRRLILRLALDCLIIPFLVVITLVSRTVLEAMGVQTLMSLPDVSMNVMYASVPFGCILMTYYLLRLAIQDIRRLVSLRKDEE